MSNQEIADSGVLRNSLTSLSPFPFKACSERIIDFHFLALKKMRPPFYFASMLDRVLLVWDWEMVKQPNKLPNFPASKQIKHQIEFSDTFKTKIGSRKYTATKGVEPYLVEETGNERRQTPKIKQQWCSYFIL